MAGIVSYGGYIPRYRLNRMTVVQNMAWYFPVIMAVAQGEKAVANWDEDAISMAVAASQDCLIGQERADVDGVYLSSTTLPYDDRLNAGILSTALNLNEKGFAGIDFSSSLKSGTTAMIAALEAVQSGSKRNVLVAASDQRGTKMATMLEMFYGDGAAAFSMSCDFVDHYRGSGKEFDYGWEERWVRDEGYGKIIPEAIRGFLAKSGMAIGDFDKVIYPCYFTGTHRAIAKSLGIDPSRVQDNLHALCGDTGTAHPLVMLAASLETAAPGDRILMASFGQGCDVLAFTVTPKIKELSPRQGIAGSLANRTEMISYQKFSKFRDLITADLGIRGEANPNTSLTVLWRNRRMIMGLVGAQCNRCGTPQYPPTSMCVNPECHATHDFSEYEFAGLKGEILMFTGDMLAASVDPPAVYGMVGFDGGGRILLDFTDCDLSQVQVGQKVKLSFRKRHYDEQRGFTGYFWKAVPVLGGGA